jgi:16S rRNA (guanine527-N7)-methyltransferase
LDIILKYFPNLNQEQLGRLAQLGELYAEWNEKINVISRKDMEHLYEKHVLHSMSIYRFAPFQPGSKVLDIGTGGGFPGIPLAILMPEVKFTLVDSIGKKIKVVQGVAEALGLQNVEAYHERAEKIKGRFDFVVSRAVTVLPELLAWSYGKYEKRQINGIPNGLICLKGGDLKEEIKAAHTEVQEFKLSDYFEEEFFETKKLIYVPTV